MNFTVIFTIVIAILLLRVFWLRVKASGTRTENFKQLAPKDQLSVLKECLLNNPTERNLQNLKTFVEESNMGFDVESYRPFMAKQLEISKKKDALAEDEELYTEEARWLDSIRPFEFNEAQEAKNNGDISTYIERSIEGIARLYSDETILAALEALVPDYSKASDLMNDYKELMKVRDASGADEESLEKLRKLRNKWDEDLLNIQ